MAKPLGEPIARTIVVPNGNAQTLDALIPLTGLFVVDSVVATVDDTAGPDVRPTLVARDPAGVVIATKRPSDVIPAADTGSVTWALRLADEPAPPAPPAPAALDLLWEFTVGPFSQAQVDTSVDGTPTTPFPQTYKELEVVTFIHEDTIAAGRGSCVMKVNASAAIDFDVTTLELAGNAPAFNNSFITNNGVVYACSGQTIGKRGSAMTTRIPGYASTAINKAGITHVSGWEHDGVNPDAPVLQTIAWTWNPAAPVGISRLRWATIGPAGITEFAVGSYFAVYGRR